MTRLVSELTKGPSSTNHIVVFLDDIRHPQLRASSALTDVLGLRSDVLTVRYDRRSFDAHTIISTLALNIAGVSQSKVTFVGSLAGALLAHDVIAKLKQKRIEKKYRLIFVQTPIDAVSGLRSLTAIRAHAWHKYITQHPGTQADVLDGVPLLCITTAGQRSVMPAKWSRTPVSYPRIVVERYEEDFTPLAAAVYWGAPIMKALKILNTRF